MSLLNFFKIKQPQPNSAACETPDASVESGWLETLSRWETVVDSNPDDIEACVHVIHAHANLGNEDTARQKMAELEERFPENRLVLTNSARLLQNLGDTESARERWESLCDKTSGEVEPFINLASMSFKNEDLANATRLVDLALEIEPEEMRALILKAKILLKKENWSKALEIWQLVNSKRKVHYESDLQIALCLMKLERYTDAISSIDDCLEKHDRTVPLMQVKLKALNRLEHTEEAMETVEQLLKLQGGNHELYFEKARILMQVGDLDQAETACKLALDAEPKNVQYLTLYARIGQKRVALSNAA